MLSESKYLANFYVEFLRKKPQTLLIPVYSTTILSYRTVVLYSVYRDHQGEGFLALKYRPKKSA